MVVSRGFKGVENGELYNEYRFSLGDGCSTMLDVLNPSELYTYKWVK